MGSNHLFAYSVEDLIIKGLCFLCLLEFNRFLLPTTIYRKKTRSNKEYRRNRLGGFVCFAERSTEKRFINQLLPFSYLLTSLVTVFS